MDWQDLKAAEKILEMAGLSPRKDKQMISNELAESLEIVKEIEEVGRGIYAHMVANEWSEQAAEAVSVNWMLAIIHKGYQ